MKRLKLPIKSFMEGLYYKYTITVSNLNVNLGERAEVTVVVRNPMNQPVPGHEFNINHNGSAGIGLVTNSEGIASAQINCTKGGLNSLVAPDGNSAHFNVQTGGGDGSKVEVFLDSEAIIEGPYAKPAGGAANYGVIVKDEQLMFINIEMYLKGWPPSAGLYTHAYLNPSFQYTFNEVREMYQMTVSTTLASDDGKNPHYALPGYFSYMFDDGMFAFQVPLHLLGIDYTKYTLLISTVLPVVKK